MAMEIWLMAITFQAKAMATQALMSTMAMANQPLMEITAQWGRKKQNMEEKKDGCK